MKMNKSAPLTPLAPPAGITGTTLPDDLTEDEIALAHVQSWPKAGILDSGAHLDSPVKDTPAKRMPSPEELLAAAGFVPVVPSPVGPVGKAPTTTELLELFLSEENPHHGINLVRNTVLSCNASHAAKDAKIRALEEAAKDLIREFDGAIVSAPDISFREFFTLAHASVESARTAIALPCAPLGS